MRQQGLWGYFDLLDWYNSSFNSEDKNLIQTYYKPMGGSYKNLIEGEGIIQNVSAIWLLNSVAGFLIKKEIALDIGIIFLEKGESLLNNKKSFSDLHFLYLNFTKAYKAKGNFEKALEYSKKMIEISEYVSREFIKEYGKNEVSHQGFIDYLDYLDEMNEYDMIIKIEEKARNEKWRGF